MQLTQHQSDVDMEASFAIILARHWKKVMKYWTYFLLSGWQSRGEKEIAMLVHTAVVLGDDNKPDGEW